MLKKNLAISKLFITFMNSGILPFTFSKLNDRIYSLRLLTILRQGKQYLRAQTH